MLWRALSFDQSSIKTLTNLANITLIRRDMQTTAHLIARLEALNPDQKLIDSLKASFNKVVALTTTSDDKSPFLLPFILLTDLINKQSLSCRQL